MGCSRAAISALRDSSKRSLTSDDTPAYVADESQTRCRRHTRALDTPWLRHVRGTRDQTGAMQHSQVIPDHTGHQSKGINELRSCGPLSTLSLQEVTEERSPVGVRECPLSSHVARRLSMAFVLHDGLNLSSWAAGADDGFARAQELIYAPTREAANHCQRSNREFHSRWLISSLIFGRLCSTNRANSTLATRSASPAWDVLLRLASQCRTSPP